MFEYATLRVIWWLLLGILLCGFAIMDGFDLGVAALLPFIARNDIQRRITINTVGPVWEGNQVWIILGAGAIFAAWPTIYAVSFSGFYLAMLLLLMTFIIRPVGFKYRSKVPAQTWRSVWDWGLSIAAIVACLVFGVAVGNVIQGVPFHFNDFLRAFYTGGFFALFNPFALLCGLLSLAMLIMHGAVYLNIKTEGEIQHRAKNIIMLFALITIVLFAVGGYWVTFIKGYVVTSNINPNGPSNPLGKSITMQTGAWLANYFDYKWMLIAPIMGFAGAICVMLLCRTRYAMLTFIASGASIFGVICTVGLSMFPFIMPSSTNPGSSLLVWDASSSQTTLEIMLVAAVIFMPIIIAYTSWVFWVLRGKVTDRSITENDQAY